MSKIKEIDEIAERIAEITLQLIEDSVDWQIADQDLDGDEYSKLHDYVVSESIEKLYKNNTINSR
jgi:hypothetical protein